MDQALKMLGEHKITATFVAGGMTIVAGLSPDHAGYVVSNGTDMEKVIAPTAAVIALIHILANPESADSSWYAACKDWMPGLASLRPIPRATQQPLPKTPQNALNEVDSYVLADYVLKIYEGKECSYVEDTRWSSPVFVGESLEACYAFVHAEIDKLAERNNKTLHDIYEMFVKAGLSRKVAEKATFYCQAETLCGGFGGLTPFWALSSRADDALYWGFKWHETPEGYKYWDAIYVYMALSSD